ncbi:hypothetical protein Rcae01_03924 [Novipirellula caenicola]|uniref:Secreted protein n=1 Tax=Novipirellula caenicola TaxID=1536901 RepID=A0ABP9VW55_9BACT
MALTLQIGVKTVFTMCRGASTCAHGLCTGCFELVHMGGLCEAMRTATRAHARAGLSIFSIRANHVKRQRRRRSPPVSHQ